MTTARFVLLAAFSLTAALPLVPALAQAPPMSPGMHGPHSGRMRATGDALALTDIQKARLRSVLMGASQQAQALRANTGLTPSVRAAKMHSLQQSVRTQMMAILTPAQRARAQGMQQSRRQPGHAI